MRPWRLTRRARVEMEWTLACIRGRIDACPRRVSRVRDAESVEDAAWSLLGDGDALDLWPVGEGRVYPYEREVRVVRARVALVLRAALRADEDARCEEALRKHAGSVGRALTVAHRAWADGADVGAHAMCRSLREWPALPWGRVPRALWEVAR